MVNASQNSSSSAPSPTGAAPAPSTASQAKLNSKVNAGQAPQPNPSVTSNKQMTGGKSPMTKRKRKFRWQYIIAALGLILLLVGGAAAFYLSRQSQDIRQQALMQDDGGDGGSCTNAGCMPIGGSCCGNQVESPRCNSEYECDTFTVNPGTPNCSDGYCSISGCNAQTASNGQGGCNSGYTACCPIGGGVGGSTDCQAGFGDGWEENPANCPYGSDGARQIPGTGAWCHHCAPETNETCYLLDDQLNRCSLEDEAVCNAASESIVFSTEDACKTSGCDLVGGTLKTGPCSSGEQTIGGFNVGGQSCCVAEVYDCYIYDVNKKTCSGAQDPQCKDDSPLTITSCKNLGCQAVGGNMVDRACKADETNAFGFDIGDKSCCIPTGTGGPSNCYYPSFSGKNSKCEITDDVSICSASDADTYGTENECKTNSCDALGGTRRYNSCASGETRVEGFTTMPTDVCCLPPDTDCYIPNNNTNQCDYVNNDTFCENSAGAAETEDECRENGCGLIGGVTRFNSCASGETRVEGFTTMPTDVCCLPPSGPETCYVYDSAAKTCDTDQRQNCSGASNVFDNKNDCQKFGCSDEGGTYKVACSSSETAISGLSSSTGLSCCIPACTPTGECLRSGTSCCSGQDAVYDNTCTATLARCETAGSGGSCTPTGECLRSGTSCCSGQDAVYDNTCTATQVRCEVSGDEGEGGGGGGGSCAGLLESCDIVSNPCCDGNNLVCTPDASGNQVCNQQDEDKDAKCPGSTCGKWLGFKCANNSDFQAGQCFSNMQSFGSDSAAAIAYIAGCGQADEVCWGGEYENKLCGDYIIETGSCNQDGGTPPPPPPPSYECGDSCETDAQCQTGDADHFCFNGVCRLESNPSSETCQPAVGPLCSSLTVNNISNPTATSYEVGQQVTLTCGQVSGVNRYVFRMFRPGGVAPVSINASATQANSSVPITLDIAGGYTAQCQICTGESADSCLPWEPTGFVGPHEPVDNKEASGISGNSDTMSPDGIKQTEESGLVERAFRIFGL